MLAMVTALPRTKRYSIDDLASFPDDGRLRELVDGNVVEWDVTDLRHGRVTALLAQELGAFVRPHRLGSVVLTDALIRVLGSRYDARGGDVEFFARGRLPKEQHAPASLVVPDFVIEVLSPSDRAAMVQAKVNDWLRTGVKLLWYVDPDTGGTTVYRGKTGTIVGPDETLDGGEILPGFTIRMRDILNELAAEEADEPEPGSEGIER